MVFFNDPLPVEHHELRAVRLALAAQERFGELSDGWRKRGTELGLGIGIEAGYATLGRIGFEGRYDYGAVGPVTSHRGEHVRGGRTGLDRPSRVRGRGGERRGAADRQDRAQGFGRAVAAYEALR